MWLVALDHADGRGFTLLPAMPWDKVLERLNEWKEREMAIYPSIRARPA